MKWKGIIRLRLKRFFVQFVCTLMPSKKKRDEIRKTLLDRLFEKNVDIELNGDNFNNALQINDENLIQVLKSLGRFRYIPNPGNLGDGLIANATYQFFEEYDLISMMTDDESCGNIVYGGGGIWIGELYVNSYIAMLEIFKKANKVVILPSSVYACPAFVDVLDDRFIVFCREKQTYQYLKEQNTKAVIYLDHDMALRTRRSAFKFSLSSNYHYVNKTKCVIEKIAKIGAVAKLLREDIERLHCINSDFDLSAVFYPHMNRNECKFATALALCAVDYFDIIITDRLHIGIAAALMGKEVYLMDNNYKKISSVYFHSLKSQKNIHLVDKIPDSFAFCERDKTENIFYLLDEIV